MRRLAVFALAALTLSGSLSGCAAADELAPAAVQRQITATQVIVVRPVDASGHAQPGFSITTEGGFPLDCRSAEPSPVAVSPDVDFCFPTVLGGVACWKAAAAHKALCMQDPRTHSLVQFRRQGAFADTGPEPATLRGPLGMVLGDGDYCSIRVGGAWSSPPGHPKLFGYYSCRHDGAVWAFSGATHQGVNESQPLWTVRTAQFNSSTVVTRNVVRAYFVGTFTG